NYTTTRVMQDVGVDNMPIRTFDFDPGSIVPSHLPKEDRSKPSSVDKIKRARNFADNLRFMIQPNSLHEIQQMEYKLGAVQLIKAGVKLPSSALAEAWAIRDYGSFPGNTLIDQWRSEKAEEIRMGVEAELYKQTLETGGIVAAALQPPGSA